MPSYFYHLTFELYPSANPSSPGGPDDNDDTPHPSDLWLPPRDADVFDSLPAHPPRDKALISSHKGKHLPHATAHKRAADETKTAPGVIDCGASRRPLAPGERGSVDLVTDRRRRERTSSTPLPPSTAAICPQTAVRDWRFGRVSIEGIDSEGAADMAAAGEKSNAAAFAALELGPTLGGDGSSTRAECVSLPTKNTEVGWGVVHFYRGEEMPPPGLDQKAAAAGSGAGPGEDECTTLCIPAVPSFILPAEFLGFVGEKWRGDVTHFRMVMTSRMSRYLVLLKFRDSQKAKEWRREFNGKVFNSMVVGLSRGGSRGLIFLTILSFFFLLFFLFFSLYPLTTLANNDSRRRSVMSCLSSPLPLRRPRSRGRAPIMHRGPRPWHPTASSPSRHPRRISSSFRRAPSAWSEWTIRTG